MRLTILARIDTTFPVPTRGLIQVLRLTPGDHEGQHVARWRIDMDLDGRLTLSRDSFGNMVGRLAVDGPLSALSLTAYGEVETMDTSGVVRGAPERFAPDLYLRETEATRGEDTARAIAAVATGLPPLDAAHALMQATNTVAGEAQTMPDPGPTEASAPQSQYSDMAGARDAPPSMLANRLIAAARLAGLPARAISGYCLPDETADTHPAETDLHRWTEIHIAGLGWVAFDPSAGLCATERYVRVAIGLDHVETQPVRSGAQGGVAEGPKLRITVSPAGVTSRPRAKG